MSSTLRRLSQWYEAQCDGDWEHSYGVKIETLDNPGWAVTIDLADTALAHRSFDGISVGDSESSDKWMDCRKTGTTFVGSCSPGELDRVLGAFLDWAGIEKAG